MRIDNYEDEVQIPSGVTVRLEGPVVVVKGKQGELKRRMVEPGIGLSVDGNLVRIKVPRFTKKDKTKTGTIRAHLKNMFTGVSVGHTYKLKVCSGHFPMNVTLTNNQLVVKNFIGEKIPRSLVIPKDLKVKLDGQIITIEGYDKELAGTTASCMEHLTRRANYDRRVFQDGIYIIEKDGKPVKA